MTGLVKLKRVSNKGYVKMENSEWLTVKEFAKKSNITVQAVYKKLNNLNNN